MARMFDIKVDVDRSVAHMGRLPDSVRASLKGEMNTLVTALRDRAKDYASTMFQVRTGTFVKSIKKSVRSNPKSVSGKVFSKDPKAHLLEVGARAHEITASAADALELAGNGIFARTVHHPGFQGHTIINRAFQEMKPEINDGLQQAINAGLESASP